MVTRSLLYLRQFPWKKRLSQAIGIGYGLLGIPFIVAFLPFIMTAWNTLSSTTGMSRLLMIGMGCMLVGASFVYLSLGVGFWLQKEWAYRIALVFHGTALIGSIIQAIGYIQEPQPLAYTFSFFESQLWNICVVSFLLPERVYTWWVHQREMRYWQEPPRS